MDRPEQDHAVGVCTVRFKKTSIQVFVLESMKIRGIWRTEHIKELNRARKVFCNKLGKISQDVKELNLGQDPGPLPCFKNGSLYRLFNQKPAIHIRLVVVNAFC